MEELLKAILQELKKQTAILESNQHSIHNHKEEAEKEKLRMITALKDKNPQLAEMFNIFMGGK